jgi:hypothetical protein
MLGFSGGSRATTIEKDKWCEEAEKSFIPSRGIQKLFLAKPLKLSKKSAMKGAEARSSGLSIGEKALTEKTYSSPLLVAKTSSKKAPMTTAKKDASGYVSTYMLNIVDTSASKEEASPL